MTYELCPNFDYKMPSGDLSKNPAPAHHTHSWSLSQACSTYGPSKRTRADGSHARPHRVDVQCLRPRMRTVITHRASPVPTSHHMAIAGPSSSSEKLNRATGTSPENRPRSASIAWALASASRNASRAEISLLPRPTGSA